MRLVKIAGQSLVEILIAVGVSSLIIGSVVTTYIASLNSNANARINAVATQLAQETFDNVKAMSEADWNSIYLKTKNTNYYLQLNGTGSFDVITGTENIAAGGTNYTRAFTLQNVSRSLGGDIVASGMGPDDPSTQLVMVTVGWTIGGKPGTTRVGGYISRVKNTSLKLTTWNGGSGSEGPFIGQTNTFSASTNVDWNTLPGTLKVLNF